MTRVLCHVKSSACLSIASLEVCSITSWWPLFLVCRQLIGPSRDVITCFLLRRSCPRQRHPRFGDQGLFSMSTLLGVLPLSELCFYACKYLPIKRVCLISAPHIPVGISVYLLVPHIAPQTLQHDSVLAPLPA